MSENDGHSLIVEIRAERRKLTKILYGIIATCVTTMFATYVTIMSTQTELLVTQKNIIENVNKCFVQDKEMVKTLGHLKDRVLTLEVRDGTLVNKPTLELKQ